MYAFKPDFKKKYNATLNIDINVSLYLQCLKMQCDHLCCVSPDLNGCPLYRLALLVCDHPPESAPGVLQIGEQRLPVALPLLLKGISLGCLDTGELQGDLHAVGEQVVEVLHSPPHHVPVNSVSDAPLEMATGGGTLNQEEI